MIDKGDDLRARGGLVKAYRIREALMMYEQRGECHNQASFIIRGEEGIMIESILFLAQKERERRRGKEYKQNLKEEANVFVGI